MSQPTYLQSGNTVGVVGAGPAGAFFAIELLRRARALGLDIKVDIYDGKNFAKKGAPGCNMCAGALNYRLIQEIERSTTTIPREVIHYEIEGYAVHYQDSTARLENDPLKKIYGVYRGAGPVSTENPDGARSFDQFLLDQAVKLGANHVRQNVQDIDVPVTLESRPVLHLLDGSSGEDVDVVSTERLVRDSYMRDYLPPDWKLDCHCHPRVALGAARLPYSERFVIVSDASDSRYLKNGVESALVTARLAVDCVINHGVTARDFEKHFWRRCNRVFGRDNIYGRMLFEIYDRIFPHPLLAPVYFAVLRSERKLKKPGALLSNALLAAFTGDQSYKRILMRAMNPRLAARMTARGVGLAVNRIKSGASRSEPQAVRGLRLRDGSRVAIIGGGPGGAACAIRLLRNARVRGIALRVTIYEPKQFPRHHNPCIGVLAPPTAQLLRDKLGIELPPAMIKRTIKGYRLHGDRNEIELRAPSTDEPALMVSRSEFDQLLLERAVA